ncbi:MAG TPA: pyruvate kinase [Syntrophomonadaceae bacterium]|nr:pyruvate kinase [Syntrophomonadaceae bacterium]HQA07485.1 pyruvate kinase [Syntrophomonadaceae bacterium]HQE23281.1 pyruvate kinase [Syntrophomonadaceae bacterium]
MRRTKIIATIGPASEGVETIKKMLEAGMNVARLNFSHGTHEEHRYRIENLRQGSRESGKLLAIMLDTKGPEIRTGRLAGGPVKLEAGQRFVLTSREVPGNNQEVQVSYASLPQEVTPGTIILLADGLISLKVMETTSTDIVCQVVNGGELGERKGINVPGVRINMPFMNDKDREDILFGINMGVDYIAASFVRTAEDVLEIRRILEQEGADIDIIAKIESQEGVNNLDDIIQVVDGVMVARGDLGVEIPAEEVPLVQKMLVEKCTNAGKPVIIATQMLDSMINNPRPTRAEVSDVANAIFDGADAIMLSGETAAGKYPVEVVETMARIASRAEQALPYADILRRKRTRENLSVTDAISYATCATASNLGASAIITATRTGQTAKMVAKYRPQASIVAATPDEKIVQKLALVWGVYPVLINDVEGTDDLFEESIRAALESNYINNGDLVVLTAGVPTGRSGATNLMKVHIVGEILVQGMGIGSEVAKGPVRIIDFDGDVSQIQPGDIVVTHSADSSLAPYLSIIGALIAEEGGLTSNAAIMGLNARIPVVVGARDAVSKLKDGMLVTVDTPRGRVYRGLARAL